MPPLPALKTCVVTGASSGIGLETALALGRQGARLFLLGRHPGRCRAAARLLERRTGAPPLGVLAADLAVPAEVRRAAAAILARCDRIHVLVHNAGAYLRRRRTTAAGLEMHLALNHLGPFLLNHLLLERVAASAPARIVVVSSAAHAGGRFDFGDLNLERSDDGFAAYARSKLANLLFTRELARRLEGTGVTVNALHPGIVATRFGRTNGWLFFWLRRLLKGGGVAPAEGARTVVWLATSPAVEGATGGYYCQERKIEPAPQALDDEAARRLWEASARLTGAAP